MPRDVETDLKQHILEIINEEKMKKAYDAIAKVAEAKITEMQGDMVHVQHDKLVEFHEKYRRLHEIASCPYVATLEEVRTLFGHSLFKVDEEIKKAIE